MNLSTRFAVSVHILAILYYNPDIACNSEYIAGSVNTNPVVIRRLVSKLKTAGLVQVLPGGGGIKPTRPPQEIGLYEIYQAVDNTNTLLFGLHENINPVCPVGRNINTVMQEKMDVMQERFLNSLRELSMADIMKDICKRIEEKNTGA